MVVTWIDLMVDLMVASSVQRLDVQMVGLKGVMMAY